MTISDPTLANVWGIGASAGPTSGPLLGEVPQSNGTTSPVSTYSFVGESDQAMAFWISALRGSTTLGALYFTVTCAWDPSNPPGNYPSLPGTLTSNKISTIGVNFEAPTVGGVPLLTINNLAVPTPGASSSSSAADPLSPAPVLTKVDLVYPSGQVGTISICQIGLGTEPLNGAPAGSSDLCFWDSPTGGNLVAFPGQGISINMATSSLTAVYAEALYAVVGGVTIVYSGPHSGMAYDVGGAVFGSGPTSIGLTGVGLYLGDGTTVPVDLPGSSDGSSPGPQFTPLNLELPTGLPNGTTVKISIDPTIAGLIKVYADNNGVPVPGVLFGDGLASYTWTVGSNNPPSILDVESLGDFVADANAFTMTVQLPAEPGSAGEAGETGAAGEPGECTATQPAIAPPGLLVAFDGTQDEGAGTDTNIFQFSQAYVAPGALAHGTSIYEKGTATPAFEKNSTTKIGKALHFLAQKVSVADTREGFKEMFSIVADALIRIQAFYDDKGNDADPLDIIGYSRGGIEADILANMLLNGEYVKIDGKWFKAAGKIRFVGLIAPVASIRWDYKTFEITHIPIGSVNWNPIAPPTFPAGYAAIYQRNLRGRESLTRHK